MKKCIYLFSLLLFSLFIPEVYAFSYDIDTKSSMISNNLYEITVSLDNIKGTDEGIASCSMNVTLDGDLSLTTDARALNGWSMTVGNVYLFDTGNPVVDKSEFFVIPVKLTGDGKVHLTNIKCSDGEENATVNTKTINLKYVEDKNENNQTNNGSDNNQTVTKSSDCNLTDIRLSEGKIDFDTDVTEYNIKVSNFDDLVVTPVISSTKASFAINKTNNNVISIVVEAEDGTTKTYTINVEESDQVEVDDNNTDGSNENKNNYTFIFVGIIVVLLLINVIRLVLKKNKSKEKDN